MIRAIPLPAVTRLCMIYRLCGVLDAQGIESVSSTQIGSRLGIGPHSVRKDISFLGEADAGQAGYDVARLRARIERSLGLGQSRRACVVGLGRLGAAILGYQRLAQSGYRIMAGFDSNINRLETIRTDVPLYPAYEIAEVVRREAIELGIIAVPAEAAQQIAEALIDGGIRGIVNFAPVVIAVDRPEVIVRNIDVVNELRVVSSLLTLGEQEQTPPAQH